MTNIAYQIIRLGTELQVIAYEHPGSKPLFKRSIPFDGAAITDDGEGATNPKQRVIKEKELHNGIWKTRIDTGLKNGGFKIEIHFSREQVSLTPISPRSKDPIKQKRVNYNFRSLGIEDNRETKIEKAKQTVSYTFTEPK